MSHSLSYTNSKFNSHDAVTQAQRLEDMRKRKYDIEHDEGQTKKGKIQD